jgi:2-oxoglutarate dehydrogenase E1 component
MQRKMNKTMSFWRHFHGPNAGYVLELYQRYKQNPQAVDDETRAFFESWSPPADGYAAGEQIPAAAPPVSLEKVVAVANYAQAIREFGHLQARLDPLGSDPPGDPALEPETYGITGDDLRALPSGVIGGPVAEPDKNALDAIEDLRAVYAAAIGHDYEQVSDPAEREWLRYAAECGAFRPLADPIDPVALLDRLTQVEVFERFLHRAFPGKTRFSIEGLDTMVPILDELIAMAAEMEMRDVLIGMAHRGRLNVMAHVLNKPYAQILAEFKDPVQGYTFREDLGWTGDVKYHKGARRAVTGGARVEIGISIPPNPSHLEAVNAVAAGMARAAGTRVDAPGAPRFDPDVTLPVSVHGDASFPGQGVVAETLNFSNLPGYWTGGTIHIIANNQLGYTTVPGHGRSTLYASDLAKGFRIPVVHVNADDVEACIEAARLAFAYRLEFKKDFVIDLIGYRRHGHNEGDEPAFTQPVMYSKVAAHPTTRELWAKTLVERGAVEQEKPDELLSAQNQEMQDIYDSLSPTDDLDDPLPEPPPPGIAQRVDTGVSVERLQALGEALLDVPAGFAVNRKLRRILDRRGDALQDPDAPAVDWAAAEALALASVLSDGIAVRLTGEDVARGTFSQRHAVLHDAETGETLVPLQAFEQARAAFEVHDSPLSENSVIGFEYGYAIQAPERLVIWEAQYGDFINNAQVMIDEFVASGRAKWGQTPSLVLLLPHGSEGAGPDHSSGRLERFLELAAETNMRVANPSTAAQYFHLLRRQALLLKTDPLPLVVMTPKRLLRHPMAASPLRELAGGRWQPVIDDVDARVRAGDVRRVILCNGKVYVDLVSSDLRAGHPEVAVVRVEQLYPFPAEALRAVFDAYPNLEAVDWVQEEPQNMGAWTYAYPRISELIGDGCWPLRYVGRAPSSSSAEGSAAWFAANQAQLVELAFAAQAGPTDEGFIMNLRKTTCQ